MTESKTFNSPDERAMWKKAKLKCSTLAVRKLCARHFNPAGNGRNASSQLLAPIPVRRHLVYNVSGKTIVRMDDGAQIQINPGDVTSIPPGHDAWIVGAEPYVGVDFQGAANYAKANA